MLSSESRILTAPTIMSVAGLAGLLTWFCVGLFGDHSLLTAIIAVVLAELVLASFGVIAILLTERVTLTLLNAEKQAPATPKPRSRPAPVWRRLPDVPPLALPASVDQIDTDNSTLRFPTVDPEPGSASSEPIRRAA